MLSTDTLALLRCLFHDLPGDHHVLTLNLRRPMSTAVRRDGDRFEVEDPSVVERLRRAVADPAPAALVLRTRTDHVPENPSEGTDVLVELVRGWWVGHRALVPLDEAQMFDAFCTDTASGEPIPPEPGVRYVSAPAVDLSHLEDV
ncbi:hypothetical protein [Nocardiopsis sp. MG754419]|uniref:hypothetical protein n=1 Tax=Nocardiopsis sp. MG754419 TaxID=2259865 RepID=UPI001BA44A23|nr:hypothetical protein [Nocardiopsis sp. MG754419]MBR8744876.1 hypothetical protein [Nocardiopsis sp. MG754419]